MIRSVAMLSFAALFVLMAAGVAVGQTRAELKDRFAQRYPELNRLKSQGKVGETWQGFVAIVEGQGDASARDLVKAENSDRERLYDLLAEDLKNNLPEGEREKMNPQIVAEQNAWRNFKDATDGVHLRLADEVWVTKKDRPWLLALLDSKIKGYIGETYDGDVAAVPGRGGPADQIKRVVDRENDARRKTYKELSGKQGVPVDRVALDYAKRFRKAAHVGTYVQAEDGSWEVVK